MIETPLPNQGALPFVVDVIGVGSQSVERMTRCASAAWKTAMVRSTLAQGWFPRWMGIHGSSSIVDRSLALAHVGGAACVPHYVLSGHEGPIPTARHCAEGVQQGDSQGQEGPCQRGQGGFESPGCRGSRRQQSGPRRWRPLKLG